MKKTTVVIPNYNGIKYLKDCLNFLKRSRTYDPQGKMNELLLPFHEFDTIVVDNGSTDASLSLLEREFPNVKVISLKENTGFCHAVNVGIKEAQTPYVLLLNNDTKVETFFVSKLEQAMDKNNECFSIQGKMLSMKEPEIIDDAGDLYCCLGWAFALGKGMSSTHYDKDAFVFASCAGAAIYRKEIFEQIGYFDENHFAYLEDIDIGYRARIYGYQNAIRHDAIVYHAGSGASGSRYNAFKVDLSSQNSVYIIHKNMPFLQWLINMPFLMVGFMIKTLFFIKKGLGLVYVKGLLKGIAKSFSKTGRAKKVKFSMKHVPNYAKIQLQLWWNLLRRGIG